MFLATSAPLISICWCWCCHIAIPFKCNNYIICYTEKCAATFTFDFSSSLRVFKYQKSQKCQKWYFFTPYCNLQKYLLCLCGGLQRPFTLWSFDFLPFKNPHKQNTLLLEGLWQFWRVLETVLESFSPQTESLNLANNMWVKPGVFEHRNHQTVNPGLWYVIMNQVKTIITSSAPMKSQNSENHL